MSALASLDESTFKERYWRFRHAYDLGESPARYWSNVVGRELSHYPDLIEELDQLDMASWSNANDDTVRIMADIFNSGALKISLLSNAPDSVARMIETQPWMKYLERTFFSCRLKLAKPDAAIFQVVLQELDVDAASVFFVDDRAENVRSASSIGIDAHLFTTAEDLEDQLQYWR